MSKRGTFAIVSILLSLTVGHALGESGSLAERAFALRMQGQASDARRMLEEGLAKDPGQADARFELARTCFYLLDFPALDEAATAAAAAAPDISRYHAFAGQAAMYCLIDAAHHGDQERMKALADKAVRELQEAVALAPDEPGIRLILIETWLGLAGDMGWDPAFAREQAAAVERIDPIHGARARSYELGAEAEQELWEGIMAAHRDDPLVRRFAADAFLDLGKLEDAARCLDVGAPMDLETGMVFLRLGMAQAMAGDVAKAADLTREYLDLDPPIPLKAFALGRLGMLAHREGNAAEAERYMAQAKALDPQVWATFMPPPPFLFTPVDGPGAR